MPKRTKDAEPTVALTLFAWDELSDNITEFTPEELFAANAEGSWLTEGFTEDLKVEIRTTERHKGLSCFAASREEAHQLFMQVEVYRSYQED